MSRFDRLLWSKPSRIRSYGVAVLSSASALVISRWLYLHFGAPPGTMFICAVMLSAWYGGVGPALFATALSTFSFHYFFLPPVYSWGLRPGEIPKLAMYMAANLIVGLLSAAQRNAKESLRRAGDDLSHTVQDLQRANQALRRSEAYLAEAQRLSQTGSFGWNVSRGDIHWSEETFKIFEYDAAVKPSVELVFQRIHPADLNFVQQTLGRATSERAELDFEHRLLMPDSSVKYLKVLAHASESPSGDLEYVGAVTDVTERKRAEEERERLRQAQADLARINRMTTMGELTASLAHEVNQPIAASVTNANTCIRWLAAEVPNLEKARAAAERIVKDGTRAAEIVSRIRLVFQKGSSQLELLDVNEVIAEMIVLLRGEATRYAISIRTELAADLPQVTGDRVQLQQVVMNLMINSIDAVKAVDGARDLTIKSQRAEQGQVLVSVTDNGVGLPPKEADQIFNAFFTTKSNGTGMGLRISRSIIESHGGRLWAANNSPRGATFQFTLPVTVAASANRQVVQEKNENW